MTDPKTPADEAVVEFPPLGGREVVSLGLAWLIPGAGHFLLGRRLRAAAFFVIIATAIAVGIALDGNLHRVLPNQPLTMLATLASMGMGAAYFVLRYAVEYAGNVTSIGYEYGTAFLVTAGLMNLLLVLDVWDIVVGRKE